MPVELLEPADQHLVAARRLRVIGVDAEPARDRIERAREFRAQEVRQVVFCRPLPAHALRCREACRVVDHGAAAQRRALQHDQTQVTGREQPAGIVHRFERVSLQMGKVCLVAIATLLQNDHILPGGRQLGRDDATAGSRADDNDIAGECVICRDDDGVNRLRCGRWRSEGARIPNGACCTGRRVMRDGGEAL